MMTQVLETLAKAATHDAPILLRGENGTGKSVLARRIHQLSPRHERPFVVVNCPTLSEELLASELFGHAKGAFTGAVRDQAGRVEAAEGGTLFLDEIAEMPPALQAKLLRFVQDKQFERVGETRTRRADVRVVAATNRNLDEEVKAGRFREDLLYRLNTFELTVPALRERREDLVAMARRVLTFFSRATAARLGRRSSRQLQPELSDEGGGGALALRLARQRAPGAAATPSSARRSSAPGPASDRRRCPRASPPSRATRPMSAATSRWRRSSATTCCACSSGRRRWRTPPTSSASTARRCGASAKKLRRGLTGATPACARLGLCGLGGARGCGARASVINPGPACRTPRWQARRSEAGRFRARAGRRR